MSKKLSNQSNQENNNKKSVRYNLSQEAIDKLKEIAYQYNCIYDGKGSIARLLEKIGDETLTINKPQTTYEALLKTRGVKSRIQKLKIKTPFHLCGIALRILEQIVSESGNVLKLTVEEKERGFGDIEIYTLLSADSFKEEINKVFRLIEKISNIKYENLTDFNNPQDLIKFISSLNIPSSLPITSVPEEETVAIFKPIKIATRVSSVFALRIEDKNEIGLLAKVIKIISEKRIYIDFIRVEPIATENKSVIFLFLEIKEILKKVENIDLLLEIIEGQLVSDTGQLSRINIEQWQSITK